MEPIEWILLFAALGGGAFVLDRGAAAVNATSNAINSTDNLVKDLVMAGVVLGAIYVGGKVAKVW